MKLTEKERELVKSWEHELSELHDLVERDYHEHLTKKQEERYIELVKMLQDNNVPIQFGIEI